jgi:uncharacterized glyoxalase superfamily protein PhnB
MSMAQELSGLIPLLGVFDMPESIGFYCGKLGFEIATASPEVDAPEGRHVQWAWLRSGGAELMLNTAYDVGERPPARDAARWSGHSDAILYIGCRDVDLVYRDLRAKGLELEPPSTTHYGMKQLHVRDPDGFGLCFQTAA